MIVYKEVLLGLSTDGLNEYTTKQEHRAKFSDFFLNKMASLVGCLLILLITGCNVSSCISCARTIFADLSPGLGPDRSRSKQGTGELYPKPISKDKKSSVRV